MCGRRVKGLCKIRGHEQSLVTPNKGFKLGTEKRIGDESGVGDGLEHLEDMVFGHGRVQVNTVDAVTTLHWSRSEVALSVVFDWPDDSIRCGG